MPKVFLSIETKPSAIRKAVGQMTTQRILDNCKTCRAIAKHGINSIDLCIELKVKPADMQRYLAGHDAYHKRRNEQLPVSFKSQSLTILSTEQLVAKTKSVQLALGHYDKAKKYLANCTGDRIPSDRDDSACAEKLRTAFSVEDFQRAAIDQLNNVEAK